MLARLIVVTVCVAAVVVFAQRRADARSCQDARTALFAADLRHAAPADLVGEVRDRCRDPEQVALAAVGVVSAGHRREGAALARVAIHRAPDEFSGWAALAMALRQQDPSGFAQAVRRAHALNPRWRAPAPVRAASAAAP